MSHCRWNLLPPAPDISGSMSALLPRLLYNRGITDPSAQQCFLSADSCLTYDPFLLPGMPQAVARLYKALLTGEKIAVFGDYDADGTTATALMVTGLSALGVTAIPYIPHRLTEGYGLGVTALEELRKKGITLVISVDCGISSLNEVKRAQKIGLDVIVTDHHIPTGELPPAVAVVNPKISDSRYPFTELSGVGVAYKLLQAFFRSLGREKETDAFLDLAAIGTIADMSPLTDENRYIVRNGLKLIKESPRPGLRELITQARLEPRNIDADKVHWVIGPCLNAAGRIAHAIATYNLLMAGTADEARELAAFLIARNEERQKLTLANLAAADEKILAAGVGPLIMTYDKDYHLGIAGLVASRIAEEHYRPAIVVKMGEKLSSGSCRSIPEFNITAALNDCRELLTRFGGHSQAAGFTLPTENLPELEKRLMESAGEKLVGLDLRACINIDEQVSLPELGGDTYRTIQQLEPFGRGNEVPTFISRGVELIDCRTMGNGSEHLRLKLSQGKTVWSAVAFRLGDHFPKTRQPLDIVYNLEVDEWGGRSTLRLNILDMAPGKYASEFIDLSKQRL